MAAKKKSTRKPAAKPRAPRPYKSIHSESQKADVALARAVIRAAKGKLGGDPALNAEMGLGEAHEVMRLRRARVDAAKK